MNKKICEILLASILNGFSIFPCRYFTLLHVDGFASVISQHMTREMPGIFNKLLLAYFHLHE